MTCAVRKCDRECIVVLLFRKIAISSFIERLLNFNTLESLANPAILDISRDVSVCFAEHKRKQIVVANFIN
jgi:hypothetical protein